MKKQWMAGAAPVSLAEMLKAREQRVERQQAMLKQGAALVILTLNIPGPVKRFDLSVKAFCAGRQEIEAQLKRNHISVRRVLITDENTGMEGIWAVDADSVLLKKLMIAIDEYHPLGRLFDIDIIEGGGIKVGREQVGQDERKCLICQRPVSHCAGNRRHSADELFEKTVELISDFYIREFCDRVAAAAVKSLLYEVCVSPKPGLVDRFNTGSHSDMDIFTFINSAAALTPYFRDITLAAFRNRGIPAEHLLVKVRYLGLCAEAKMYAATAGVNTHKGAIYSLGILCAAYGYAYDFSETPSTAEIVSLCAKIAHACGNELDKAGDKEVKTNGEAIYLRHRLRGARGEAAQGFPSVMQYALPPLAEKTALGWNINDAALFALFSLMAHIDDTNIIARSDYQTQQKVRRRLLDIVKQPNLTAEEIAAYGNELDHDFIMQNISSGGAADLLSIALMLLFMNGNASSIS